MTLIIPDIKLQYPESLLSRDTDVFINKDNVIASKLTNLTAHTQSGFRDIITGAIPTTAGTPPTVYNVNKGYAIDFSVEGDYIEYPNSNFPTFTNKLSIFFVFRAMHGSAVDPVDSQYFLDTTNNNTRGIRILSYAGAGHPRFRMFTASGSNLNITGNSFSTNDHLVWVFTYNGSAMEVWQNGLSVGTLSKSGNINNPIDAWRIGRGHVDVGSGLFQMQLFGVSDTVLSDDEIRALSFNPKQILSV